ncbi:MAG: hypothetical protein KDA27_17970 [Candidatus Eisenbacteria bacterium]|uniref:Uncharacterized protein n=1 Tax=Eiseniibacteriota bacterium TaxID=2212470 RepID=A0A956NEL5_UNCEI|nr:hypothetical protein [Candidatus Eisenbacteria bacterium]MCB9464200.1 hypothetical protein [Candidatus Eisenbacteria bacterium]
MLLFLGATVFRSLPSGDAVENVYQASHWDLHDRAVFVGYFAMAAAVAQLLKFVGVQAIVALGLMSGFFGALLAVSTFRLARHFGLTQEQGCLAAGVVVFSGVGWFFGTVADTYIVHTSLVTLSQVWFWDRKFRRSGAMFGLAMLVYPSSVLLTLPFYLVLAVWKRVPLRSLLVTALFAALVYLPSIALVYQEYFWGRMGIFVAGKNLGTKTIGDMSLVRFLGRGIYHLAGSLHLALPLAILGFGRALVRERILALIFLLLVPFPLWNHFLQPTYTDSYVITLYPWIAVLAALAAGPVLSRIPRASVRRTLLVGFALVYITLSSAWWVTPLRHRADEFRSVATEWIEESSADDLLLASWGLAVACNYYSAGTLNSDRCVVFEWVTRPQLDFYLQGPGRVYLVDDKPIQTALRSMRGGTGAEEHRPGSGLAWLEGISPDVGASLERDGTFAIYRLEPPR